MARDTKQDKWRQIGEKSVKAMTKLFTYSTWNFENKLDLLQAELHYLNNHHHMAIMSYEASIVSACKHRFYNEEGLAYELYGIYLIENKMVVKGLEQLRHAQEKYQKWGATKKADDVEKFIDLTNRTVDFCWEVMPQDTLLIS